MDGLGANATSTAQQGRKRRKAFFLIILDYGEKEQRMTVMLFVRSSAFYQVNKHFRIFEVLCKGRASRLAVLPRALLFIC